MIESGHLCRWGGGAQQRGVGRRILARIQCELALQVRVAGLERLQHDNEKQHRAGENRNRSQPDYAELVMQASYNIGSGHLGLLQLAEMENLTGLSGPFGLRSCRTRWGRSSAPVRPSSET